MPKIRLLVEWRFDRPYPVLAVGLPEPPVSGSGRQAGRAGTRQAASPAITDVLRLNQIRIGRPSTSSRRPRCDHLNEIVDHRRTALHIARCPDPRRHRDGRRILFPIEWKYVEFTATFNKADGTRGATRRARYTSLIDRSAQLNSTCQGRCYFEPFYQLMRPDSLGRAQIAHRTRRRSSG